MITIFKGDDTGGALGKHIFLDIETQYDLTGCTVIFNYQGVERRLTDVKDGDRREIIFSHNETAKMAVGTFKAVVIAVDSSGKVRTLTNTLPIKVSTDLADSYDENIALVRIGKTISWANIGNLPFEGQEVDISTDDRVLAALGTIIEKLGGTVKASIALLALCAATAFGYTPVAHTNSYERDGVTYAQRGGMGAATYVVTNIADRAGDARVLPKYLHFIQTDSTYPEDAAWYYAQPRHYGNCSSVKDGDYLYRNFDLFLDERAEFVVSVSGNAERFASVGVANCGTNLTEGFVSSHKPSRYYKALAGSVVDGINENGVAININLNEGGVTNGWKTTGDIHALAAVRWTLDNAKDALDAATNLAERIYFPQGWTQNFHWMVCDADHCYIVENGNWHEVTGRAVMTNFQRFPLVRGAGWERYRLLISSATSITNAWYTRAYAPDTNWVSEFASTNEMNAIKAAWANLGTKEARRATGVFWQTCHTAVYDLRRKTLKISVQETDDWYVFAVPSAGSVKSVNDYTGDVVLDADDVGALRRDDAHFTLDAYDDWFQFDGWATDDDGNGADVGLYADGSEAVIFANDKTGDVGVYPNRIESGSARMFYPTEQEDSGTLVTTGNIGGYALPNNYAALVSSGNFTNAVQDVECDPFFVPWCWLTSPWLGNGAYATGQFAQAFGFSALASGYGAVAVGTDPTASADYATAVGVQPEATAQYSVALGNIAKAKAQQAVAVGYNAQAYGQESVAVGTMVIADKDRSVAIGDTVVANHKDSVIIGTGSAAPQTTHGTNTLNFAVTDNPDSIYFKDKTLKQLVQQSSPPVVLPEKWALANVTNANGQAVGAADIGARDFYDFDVYPKGDPTSWLRSWKDPNGYEIFVWDNYHHMWLIPNYLDYGISYDYTTGKFHYFAYGEGGEEIYFSGYSVETKLFGVLTATAPDQIAKVSQIKNDANALTAMLVDANVSTTADCESISTNICKLIAPHIEPVKVLLNIYDNALEANWAFSIVNGDMKYACTTNEDITSFQKANPVLTDKQTADDYRVIVTGGEMKFFTDQQ